MQGIAWLVLRCALLYINDIRTQLIIDLFCLYINIYIVFIVYAHYD